MRVLVSGASIAGPVLAYWLTRRGFDVTVLERAPALRKTGGHAVDLFRPAMDISEQMGVIDRVLEHATGTKRLLMYRSGASRPADIDYVKLLAAVSDRHVEIMRDDLSEIYYDAGRDDIEYLFGNEITSITDEGDVTFAHTSPRRYDIVVGADGLHSGVRRLVFSDVEASRTDFLGAFLSVVSVPKAPARDGESTAFVDADRVAMIYTADHLDDARAIFLFRPAAPFEYDHRDVVAQKTLLHNRFAGLAAEVDRWLDERDRTPAFYFDAITQLRLTTWSRGRVTLVGDAGYCPGPAVGGSTSLAVVGAYVLAGEMERAGGDYPAAFAAYEQVMSEPVIGSRVLARTMAKSIMPASALGVWALVAVARLVSLLPTPITAGVARLNNKGIRFYDSMQVPNYPIPVL